MIRRSVFLALLTLASLCVALPAFAQVQSGSIVIKAVDEQNTAVPGATVTLTSPVPVSYTHLTLPTILRV